VLLPFDRFKALSEVATAATSCLARLTPATAFRYEQVTIEKRLGNDTESELGCPISITPSCPERKANPQNAMTALNAPENLNWPLAYEGEALLSQHINAFLACNATAAALAQRMHDETGTEFFEWTDHFVVSQNHEKAFRDAGFVTEATDAPVD